MNTRIINFSVGLFVILGFVALIWLALTASNAEGRFSKQVTVSASFDNVGSLKVKAPVMIGGVRVGRVSGITLDTHDFKAIVEMKLDEKYGIPKDSSAVIYTAGLVGEQYISLDPGAMDTPLENNDRIQLTQSALVMERLIGQFLTSMGNKE